MISTKARKKDKDYGIADKLNIGTWNVRGLTHKLPELERELTQMNIDIAALTETKKKLKGSQELDKYIMIYNGVEQNNRAAARVALLICKNLKHRIHNYAFIDERVILARIRVQRGFMTIIGAYSPEEGKAPEQ